MPPPDVSTDARRGRSVAAGGLKCPLLVGFTGHRDLRDDEVPAVERAVEAVLDDVVRRHPHSPLMVLTGLAEGADRLAARVAMRRGFEVIAVLPMPVPLYVGDFISVGSRDEFMHLLALATGRIELPVPEEGGGSLAGPGPARDACYATLGTFLAERSHVLVALWDGVDTRKPGGTASVVRARTSPTERPESLAWRELLPNDVIHVACGRASTNAARHPGLTTTVRPAAQAARLATPQHDGDEVTARIDAFNGDVERLGPRVASGFERSARDLFAGPLPPPRAGAAAFLRERFAAFDRLAIHWQAAASGSLLQLHVLIWSAVLCFEAFTNFQMFLGRGADAGRHLFARDGFVAVYLLLVGLAWAAASWSRRRQVQPRHLDYRSIAEALRIQFFWRLAGLDRNAAASFLASQVSVLAWMRSAVATVTLVADALHPDERSAATARTLRLVNRGLCRGQQRYFTKAALRDDRLLTVRTRTSAASFAAGMVVAIVFAATGFEWAALESLAAMLVVTAGLIASHTESLALDEHINQYAGMAYLYAAARRAVVRAVRGGDLARARAVLAAVGEEALGENASWVLLHRNRPLRVPQA